MDSVQLKLPFNLAPPPPPTMPSPVTVPPLPPGARRAEAAAVIPEPNPVTAAAATAISEPLSLAPPPPAARPIPVTVPPPPPEARRAEAAAVIPERNPVTAAATPEPLDANASSMRIMRSGIAVAEFAGVQYGPEYLSLRIGDRIQVQKKWHLDNGWAYGARIACDKFEQDVGVVTGWFPSTYVRTAGVGKACCDFSPVDYSPGFLFVARGDWVVLSSRIDRNWAFATKIADGPADAVQMALRDGPYGCIPMAIWCPVARLNA